MTGKLMLHTILCAFVVFSLYLRLKDTTRRREVIALMVAAAVMGAAPHIYNALPRGVFPRMTIHWAQLLFLAVNAAWFAPWPSGKTRHDAPWTKDEDEIAAFPETTKPSGMPLH